MKSSKFEVKYVEWNQVRQKWIWSGRRSRDLDLLPEL